MDHHNLPQPDFGTGQKTLGIYIFGVICCVVLTLISFGTVMYGNLSRDTVFAIIYFSAVLQFLVQVICFLRLNTATKQSRLNVMSILFTIVILTTIVLGSLWIMDNLRYYMTH